MDEAEIVGASGIVAVVATFVLCAVMAVRTRPRTPRPGPATMALGPEPPAVVDLLTDRFEVTPDAVPATLLDLAARRWVTIEEPAPGHVMVRIRRHGTGDGDPAPFERQLLDHLRGLAVDGVVPAGALTTGTEAAAGRWWKQFRRAVVSQAQDQGLCRRRWPGAATGLVWVGIGLAVAAGWGAGALAGEQPEPPPGQTSEMRAVDLLVVVAYGGAFALGGVAAAITASDSQRDTDAGLAAASRWLGVREYLAAHGDFARKPAAAVTVWDRYLAHAAALDLAPVAVAQLPLGAEDDHHAWSRVTGQWRHVVVAYPWLRPGYGTHPVLAVLGALVVGGPAAVAATRLAPVAAGSSRWVDDLAGDVAPWSRWVGGVALVVAALVATWSLLKLLGGLADVFATATVRGVVLRRRVRELRGGRPALRPFPSGEEGRRRYFLAVDDGSADRVAAWRVRPTVYWTGSQGASVEAAVTPRLRYVRRLEAVAGGPDRLPGADPNGRRAPATTRPWSPRPGPCEPPTRAPARRGLDEAGWSEAGARSPVPCADELASPGGDRVLLHGVIAPNFGDLSMRLDEMERTAATLEVAHLLRVPGAVGVPGAHRRREAQGLRPQRRQPLRCRRRGDAVRAFGRREHQGCDPDGAIADISSAAPDD